MDWITRAVDTAVRDFAASQAFRDAVGQAVLDSIGRVREPQSWRHFVWKIAAEIHRCARGQIGPDESIRMGRAVYAEFKRDNRVKRFGEAGWDWTTAAAKVLAHEYEIDCW